MIGIYKITSPTGKVYIGQSVNIELRFYTYKKTHCKKQPILYKSLKKHGVENHLFEVVEECSVLELNNKERYYQDLYSALGKKGLNCMLTKSSDRSGKLSLKTIEKQKTTRLNNFKKIKEKREYELQKLKQKSLSNKEASLKLLQILKEQKKYKIAKLIGISRPTLDSRLRWHKWKLSELTHISKL